MKLWAKDSEQAVFARKLDDKKGGVPATYESFCEFIETRPADTVAKRDGQH